MKTYEWYLKEADKWISSIAENRFKESNIASAKIAEVFIRMAEEVRKSEKRAQKKEYPPHYI